MVELQESPGLDAVFAAIADPTRRAIVDRLGRGEATISELADPFAMSLQAVSKHLGVLEHAGLVEVEKRGRSRHTRLRAEPLAEAAGWIERYRAFWESKLAALAAYVEEPTKDGTTPKARTAGAGGGVAREGMKQKPKHRRSKRHG